MRRTLCYQRGFVMLAVLMTLVVVAAIGLLLTVEGGGETGRTARATEALQADYAVLAALEHAAWNADSAACSSYALPTTSFGTHSYSATYSAGAGSPIDITATATLASGISRTLSRGPTVAHQASNSVTLQLGTDPGADVLVDKFWPTRNYGGSNYLRISADPSWLLSSLLRFDVSAIPFGAYIQSARLELKMQSLQNAGSAAVRRLTRAWVEGTKNGGGIADGATWNTYNGSNAWTTAGGDIDSAVVSRTTIKAGDTSVAFDLAPLVQQWVDGAPNYGVALVGEGALRTAEFTARETNNPSDRPKLTITYACECGVACARPQGTGNLLFVVGNAASPVAGDVAKAAVFGSWGYTVSTIDDDAVQSAYDTQLIATDVVYVSSTVNDSSLVNKLANAIKGVVSEQGLQNDNLGIATSASWATGDTLTIANNTHAITQPFATGPLRIYGATVEATTVGGTAAPGLTSLGTWSGTPSLAVLEAGAQKSGGGTATGRRALLPLGRNLDWQYLNNNGRLLVQRALEWGKVAGSGTGPMAHWMLDDGTGLTAMDSVGGHHGTLTNGPIWVTGQQGDALDFDGVDDYVDLTSDAELDNVFAGPATVMAWINPASWGESNYGRILDKDDNLTLPGSGWAIEFDGPNARLLLQRGFASAGGEWATPAGSLKLNTWQHIAVAYDGATAANNPIIYIDGSATTVTKTRSPAGAPTSDASINLRLGNYALATSRTFRGRIDDVRIYKGLLTSAEVADVAAAGDAGGGSKQLLYVVSNPSALTTQEAARQALMAGWGFVVTLIDDDATQAKFTAETAANDVAYISSTVVTTSLGNKLTAAPLGVVNENRTMAANLGLVADAFDATSGSSLVIEDNAHYITTEFSLGPLTILTAPAVLHSKDDDLAPDIVGLGSRTGAPTFLELAVIDPGGMLWDGREAAGRRVQLPWGDSAFNVSTLTADGRKLMRRAIEWGAGAGGGGGGGSLQYLDRFSNRNCSAADFAGSDGPSDWSPWAWLEMSDDGASCAGDVRIEEDSLIGDPGNYRLKVGQAGNAASRQADLSAFASAYLSFDYRRVIKGSNYVTVDVRADGSSPWVELDRFLIATDSTYTKASFDITAYISANTQIRFYSSGLGGSEYIYADNIQIDTVKNSGGVCNGTFRDEFNTKTYSANDGTLTWAGDWIEIGESDGPTAGDEQVVTWDSDFTIRTADNDNGGEGVEREADLTGADSATLTYDYRRRNLDDANDYTSVEISANGASGPWTELTRYQGAGNDGSFITVSHDISSFISANTRIRFKTSANMGTQDSVHFDNVEIQCVP